MNETIRGVYRNGVIEPAEPLKIAEGTEVYVVVPRRHTREEILELYKKLEQHGLKLHYNPENIGKPFPEVPLGKIKGKPLSETIIEDRGPR
ncbi:MAG: antitoxin family protein [candidate division KSB1 bacterium]|nr:antitoxin family protein [candidate division KSB1 bacterium]MDZ7300659.1 antitoxin family protein [candidate division KSB1 bacterium]MDZ7309796.1 antitoxin family protein [candidate division KSB1 bacterium]